MTDTDSIILEGLKAANYRERGIYEKNLYLQFSYFIEEGCRKKNLRHDDSFNAYSDSVLSAIHNIIAGKFDGRSSLKTYLFQIFSNKCVDLIRKNTTNKDQVHRNALLPELFTQISDDTKNAIEKMMTDEKRSSVKKYVHQMGQKCKEILLMYEDGVTDKEIAEALNYNNSAVAKTTRLRCIEKLKNSMQNILSKV